MRFGAVLCACLLLGILPPVVCAQNWGQVRGRVLDKQEDLPIPGVTVVVAGTNFGTASGADGSFMLRLPEGRYALRLSAVGYVPYTDSVVVRRDRTTVLDAALEPALVEMQEVMVEDAQGAAEAGVHTLSPDKARRMPTPFKGLQALKALPGVATNNELSNQYSVRGGGFNENLIFINGFEVHLPFRPRQGEQEGLGLLNPDLARRITLYTGGFPARYGGKLSSALDVRYQPPQGSVRGAASLSLLDASATAGASALDGRLGWMLGLRKARAQHFFSTQELKGSYRPDYTDLQGLLSYRIAPGHTVEALGIWADHTFHLDPRSRKTYFGTVSADPRAAANLKSLWVRYNGREEDGYTVRFGGLRLSNRLSSRLQAAHDIAHYSTVETEQYHIDGSAVLFQVDPHSGSAESGEGHIPTGNVRQQEQADNRVAVDTWTGQGRWLLSLEKHAVEAGWSLRRLHFSDRISQRSGVTGRTLEGDVARVVIDSLHDQAALDAVQAGLYVQDAFDVLSRMNQLVITTGLRTDYFSFNDAWTVSPRLSARFLASDRLTLSGSWGIYHQAPTYRELRGLPESGETILGTLNHDLKAQRAMQFVAGTEYFFPKRRLYLRSEAYYKHLTHLISYTVENVRVLYSGENDARGYAYGLDLQLRGELVPGLESWINYSYLKTSERFVPPFQTSRNEGFVPRPTDQRHTFSTFIQDYIPGDPTWKLHLRGLFGSGLPYTPPVPGPRVGGFVTQAPGDRHTARYPSYTRVDLGVTKDIALTQSPDESRLRLELTAELLNIFDMTNTVAYHWVPGGDGIWQRIPTRLTPRTFNVRARVTF